MAKYDLNYSEFEKLGEAFSAMGSELESEIKNLAREIGEDLKSEVESRLYDIAAGSEYLEELPKHGVHFADDVKLKVTTDDNDKYARITVNGGKATGKLWWTLDQGHIAKNGRFVAGHHFTDDAYSRIQVAMSVDSLLNKLAEEKDE